MIDLIKFTNEKYVKDILDGNLYMNSIGYFWNNGFDGQRDYREGIAYYKSPNDSYYPDDLKQVITGNVAHRKEGNKYCNVFSLYKLNRYKNQVEQIENAVSFFGECAVHIINAEEFILRVMRAANKTNNLFYCCGAINYYDIWDNATDEFAYDIFCKPDALKYQHEWRISALYPYSELIKLSNTQPNEVYEKPYILPIGDIRDIVEVVPTKELIHNTAKCFADCSVVKQLRKESILTPQIAEKWYKRGVVFPRAALEWLYWGNITRNGLSNKLDMLGHSMVKAIFSIVKQN